MIKKYLIKVVSLVSIAASTIVMNPICANAFFQEDSKGQYRYSEGSSWVKGWKMINDLWYYFYPSNGCMAHDAMIGKYKLDYNGAWIKPSKGAEEARALILKEDGNYISKAINDKEKLTKSYREGNIEKFIANDKWKLPEEEVYEFILSDTEGISGCGYLVGKKSENVYCIPSEGGLPVFQIKNNEKVKTYKWIDSSEQTGNVSQTCSNETNEDWR